MGPPTFGAPGNCPICPPLKPALHIDQIANVYIIYIYIYIYIYICNSHDNITYKRTSMLGDKKFF